MSGTPKKKVVLLGNEAIGRGLVEAGCQLAMSYPGTPSSEILPSFIRAAKAAGVKVHGEWSANEKVAYEEALAAAYTGKRAAVIMKQVGLNVAADPMMSSAYIGVKGGFVVICADDPGPHSSQTEQDTRLFGFFAKIPVLDPSSPDEARRMVPYAFELSERHEIPVILRPSLRVCHGRESCELGEPARGGRPAKFEKDPHRWAATPRWRLLLHKKLNEKLRRIALELESSPWNAVLNPGAKSPLAIIAAGNPFATIRDILAERGVLDRVPMLKVGAVYPLPQRILEEFVAKYERVLVVEEPDQVVELQLRDRRSVMGRGDGTVPDEGELTAGVLTEVLGRALHAHGIVDAPWSASPDAAAVVSDLKLPVRPASLCPGCPHRSAFYGIRKTFGKKGIYTSDIGCYTLGLNLDAVDTCHDMGAAISMATGFYHAYAHDGGEIPPIVATIGDSTFYHAGLPALAGAINSGARYVLVVLDNFVTAMTGMQPTLALGQQADGTIGPVLPIEDACRGLGVQFVRVHDPYDLEGMTALLKEAQAHCRGPDGRVAVIVSRHPCLLNDRKTAAQLNTHAVEVNDKCNGCALCRTTFECQALVPAAPVPGKEGRFLTAIDPRVCAKCGQCVAVCNRGAIVEIAKADREERA
ncbi:MAG: thiamine pyrophosphate-dependent enzyme [Proteobacteria bacterium]|jgi:indolepyruvate ferredoxin oxidoreductase alpha subunit|nr:thiamine pyrophosphate-dependent enzyme [Pseudomonadota bacterium]